MKKNVIITISRQFGSNGREIARQLAEYLDIGYYNKEILQKIASDMGVCPDFFIESKQDENGMFKMETHGLLGFSNLAQISVNSQVYERAKEIIEGIAQRESAVIVGRCADYILKDHPNVICVFCYSDIEQRIRWSINEYNVPAKQAKKIVLEKDQERSRFYEFYTNRKWGEAKNYHLMINTSQMPTEEVVKLLASYFDQKIGVEQFKGAFQNQYIDQKIDHTLEK